MEAILKTVLISIYDFVLRLKTVFSTEIISRFGTHLLSQLQDLARIHNPGLSLSISYETHDTALRSPLIYVLGVL